METRANYAIIGIFTIAVIAAAFGFVYWFSGTESGAKRTAYRIAFETSVAGLNKGAAVLFNGIRVGEVTEVYFDTNEPAKAFARIEVQPDTPVNAATKASLDVQLLSGTAVVALSGGEPKDAPKLVAAQGKDAPVIEAQRGGLGDLLASARNTADQATTVLTAINGIINQNRGAINATLGNVETFSKALADNAPQIDGFLRSIGDAANRIGPVAAKLEILTDEATGIVRSIEPARVNRIVRNVEELTTTVSENRERLAAILTATNELVDTLKQAAPKVESLLDTATVAAASVAPVATRIATLSDDATRLVRSVDPGQVSRIVTNADTIMATVGDNRERVADILRNTSSLTQRLNDTAPQLQRFIATLSRVAENLNPLSAKLSTLTDAVAVRIGAINPDEIRQTVAAAYRFVDGLAAVTPDTQQTIRNANSLTAKLNASADRIDGLIRSAQDFLGSAAGQEGKSTFQAVREAALAFQRASENLERRATQIAEGVTRFSGSGSRVVEGLGADARRAVNTVGRAASTLEKNPSSVIFGTGRAGIPDYSGR